MHREHHRDGVGTTSQLLLAYPLSLHVGAKPMVMLARVDGREAADYPQPNG